LKPIVNQARERHRDAKRLGRGQREATSFSPSGAAAKLGIPHQTLDSKITALGIDKHQYKSR
jgi:DNA-binding NtrC family response regulator